MITFLSYYQVEYKGKKRALTPQEYKVLRLLASEKRVWREKELIQKGWGYIALTGTEDVNLRVHIYKIRKKLGNEVVRTIRAIGYKIGDEDEAENSN